MIRDRRPAALSMMAITTVTYAALLVLAQDQIFVLAASTVDLSGVKVVAASRVEKNPCVENLVSSKTLLGQEAALPTSSLLLTSASEHCGFEIQQRTGGSNNASLSQRDVLDVLSLGSELSLDFIAASSSAAAGPETACVDALASSTSNGNSAKLTVLSTSKIISGRTSLSNSFGSIQLRIAKQGRRNEPEWQGLQDTRVQAFPLEPAPGDAQSASILRQKALKYPAGYAATWAHLGGRQYGWASAMQALLNQESTVCSGAVSGNNASTVTVIGCLEDTSASQPKLAGNMRIKASSDTTSCHNSADEVRAQAAFDIKNGNEEVSGR